MLSFETSADQKYQHSLPKVSFRVVEEKPHKWVQFVSEQNDMATVMVLTPYKEQLLKYGCMSALVEAMVELTRLSSQRR
jgi:hypothetical protein